MRPIRIHTVFFSPTGTSKKIAASVAQGLSGGAIPVTAIDLTHAATQEIVLSRDTVAVIAAPVYGGRIPPTALERLRTVRGAGTPAVVIALYGNRAFESAAGQLAEFAAAQGFVPVAAAAFVGEHSYSTPATPIAAGRPDAQDLAAAADFGGNVRQRLAADHTEPVDANRLKTPRTPLPAMLRFVGFYLGNRLRQKRNPVVRLPACDARRCIGCGRCAALCPTQAISPDDPAHTEPTRCLRCCACVKGCAVGARSFHTPFAAALARSFSRRKPPVTLL